MKLSKARLALVIALTAFLSIGTTYAWQNGFFVIHIDGHRNPQIRTNVCVTIETKLGVSELATSNNISDYGEQLVRDIFSGGGTAEKWDYIAYGNLSGTGHNAKTALDSQNARHQGTIVNWTNSGDYALNCTYKKTFSSTVRINGTALHHNSTGNSAVALTNFPGGGVTFNNNDNCTITWVITFDAN